MSKYKQTFAEALKDVREKKSAFRISYSKQGTHAGFEDADSLADLQKKAADLRSKGFTIDKMGRNTSPNVGDMFMKKFAVKEDYEVSMAIGQLRTINEYATKLISILEAKGSDYNIEAWVQSKITTAEDYMNSVGHYMENNPEITNEAKEEEPEVKKAEPKKDSEALESQIADLKNKLALTTQKLENEKNKVVKPEANPETGEVPLRTGLANAILDKKIDTKDMVQSKKKKEIKVGGKTNIEVNPDVDIGNYSGGMRTNNGNLH